MGWYGKITNRTKKQKVAANWCKDVWCTCYHVMHQFHWNKCDIITSFGDATCYNITYDDIKNEMVLEADIEWSNKIHEEEPDEELIKYQEEIKNAVYYGFDNKEFEDDWDKYNHVPEWVDNKCVKCDYVYDEIKLSSLEKLFQKMKWYYNY
ncbi:hypothetical protein Klosneuvirus_5_49 [Klosneuvirus KNV1]|uniref:Uncharacterized protein n=1 Tax=Klosneuvirus KNV1 TaxID=1977640 RepID=A0A1V0SKW0_9VIRU|nr:hypothetical protein Klosneuvirus_5_49 [Klosneuvirus KNV1]